MRRLIGLAVACFATGAGAACNIHEAGIMQRHAALAETRGVLTAEAAAAFAALRQAAEALDRAGQAAACDAVVSAAAVLIEDAAAWDAATEAPTGALNLSTFAALDAPVTSGALAGRQLWTRDGGTLGTVEGVVLDQGRDASHVIVRSGRWAEGREIAVPSARLLVDPDTGRLFAEFRPERLAEAPAFRSDGWDPERNDAWYDAQAAAAIAEAGAGAARARAVARDAAATAMAAAPDAVSDPAAEPAPETVRRLPERGAPLPDGPKRIRLERDRPESAQGSSAAD